MTTEGAPARWAWLLAPTPRPFWIAVAVVSTAAWFLVGSFDAPPGFDWQIYGDGFRKWQQTGSPYEVLPPGWDPCRDYPYMYPPSSWPLLPLAATLPYQVVALGALPLLWTAPRLVFVPIAGALLFTGLGAGLWLANVNVLIAGLLSLAFLPGRAGGLALAIAVAIKGYPIVLLPLLWNDRVRLRWFMVTLAALAASGTVLLGPSSWRDMAVTLLGEGPHCDTSLNPFAGLGWWRIIPAAVIAATGWRLRSPTVTLLGTTLATGVLTRHYLPTLMATLPHEPFQPQKPRRAESKDPL